LLLVAGERSSILGDEHEAFDDNSLDDEGTETCIKKVPTIDNIPLE
jgi:hypothetical protein